MRAAVDHDHDDGHGHEGASLKRVRRGHRPWTTMATRAWDADVNDVAGNDVDGARRGPRRPWPQPRGRGRGLWTNTTSSIKGVRRGRRQRRRGPRSCTVRPRHAQPQPQERSRHNSEHSPRGADDDAGCNDVRQCVARRRPTTSVHGHAHDDVGHAHARLSVTRTITRL